MNSAFEVSYHPGSAQLKIMQMRAELMIAIRECLCSLSMSQEAAAQEMDISQPRLSNLLNGHIDKFSVESLIKMALKLGIEVRLEL